MPTSSKVLLAAILSFIAGLICMNLVYCALTGTSRILPVLLVVKQYESKITTLLEALIVSDSTAVEKALRSGADPNGVYYYNGWATDRLGYIDGSAIDSRSGELALYPALNNDLASLQVLIQHGLTVDDERGYILLRQAILNNNYDIAKELIQAGTEVNYQWRNGDTPLRTAVIFNTHEIVELLLESGADPNTKYYGQKTPFQLEWVTPIFYAIYEDDARMVSLLLEHGANVNFQVKDGTSVAYYAELKGNPEIVGLVAKHVGRSAQ